MKGGKRLSEQERGVRIQAALYAAKKATPGPWTDDICTLGPDGKPIQVCTENALLYGEGDEESRANSILIGCAPLLAEEVIRLRKRLERDDELEYCTCGSQYRDQEPNDEGGFDCYTCGKPVKDDIHG